MGQKALYKELCREIIEEIKKNNITDQQGLNSAKMKILRKNNLKTIPKNIDITSFATDEERETLRKVLTIKPARTNSGVATIAVMPRPIACRHGKCSYCPGGPGSIFGNVPQSYTGKEPATRRAIRNSYDPYLQVSSRLEQYMAMNRVPDKVELIIMGGTFTSFPLDYQEEFIKCTYKAMNDFSAKFFDPVTKKLNTAKFNSFFRLPADLNDDSRTLAIQDDLLKMKGETNSKLNSKPSEETANAKTKNAMIENAMTKNVILEEQQKANETAKIRLVALCFETRPDWSNEPQIDMMLKLGATRVEIGVQTVYNRILERIKRMHTVEDTIKATQLLKDSFLKIGYHMMPGLPDVTREQDIHSLNQIVQNPDFMPDALKIYPCMVLRGTELYEDWKKGTFNPITTEQSADIITEFKKNVPKWLRIMRVQRDIPTFMTESGVDKTNLRQYFEIKLKEKGVKCSCIRCREPKSKEVSWNDVKMFREDYDASGGKEIFISCEDTKNDVLVGFARIRKPYKPFRREIDENTLGIRELHVYGPAVNIGAHDSSSSQHRGIGKSLIAEAEKIAKEDYDARKMLVISGVGVREYYRKFGYETEGPYMGKKL